MKDGTFYVWGKNDSAQLGVGSGIGIDMVECENIPIAINVMDKTNKSHIVKDFMPG